MNTSVANTYNRKKITFSHGKGIYLFTNDNKKYIDLAAGIAVNLLGHSNKSLIDALQKQSKKLWHVSNLYQIEEQEILARKLTNLSFADKVFFCNSGAEAVECSIKAARRYQFSQGYKEKKNIITFRGSFHGRTLGTIAASNNINHLEGFGLPLEGFINIERNNLDQLLRVIDKNTAAILIEPIQGEGGINVFDRDFLMNVESIARDKKILLLLDEVQCGMGRTGKMFAHELFNIKPDIMALAKGLGGGFPIGACLMTSPVGDAMNPGTHGSTFGGNPLAMAVGNCVTDIVSNPDFLSDISDKANLFHLKLNQIAKKYPNIITGIKGLGLMIGIKCNIENTILANELYKNGVLTVNAGDNVVRILPPLNITIPEINKVTQIIKKSVQNIDKENATKEN